MQYVYAGCYTSPGKVVRTEISPSFQRTDVLILETGENYLLSGVIDNANGFAYFGTDGNPAKIIKIDLSTFTRVGAITLDSGDEDLWGFAQIDTANGFAYFSAFGNPAKIIKIDLSTFTKVGSYAIPDSYNILGSAIDITNGFLYLSEDYGDAIYKISLSTFNIVDHIHISSYYLLDSMTIDSNYLYCGAYNVGGYIHRIRLSDFSHIDTININQSDYYDLDCAGIDTAGGFIYFGQWNARVHKIRISPFEYVSTIIAGSAPYGGHKAIVINGNGYAYIGRDTFPGKIARIRLSDFTHIDTVTFLSGENQIYHTLLLGTVPATPCDNNLSQQPPIGGSCETFSDPTPNFKSIRSESEASNTKVSFE